jgi:hypothetical protein
MKHLGLVHILLLFLVAGLLIGPATAELTASQNVPPSANVGESVMVTVVLTYSGSNATQAIITPGLSPGLETNSQGGRAMELYPGIPAPLSYPVRAVQSGTYLITSLVSYSEEGTWRNLRLESPFTASGQLAPGQQPYPGQENPGVWPEGNNPYGTYPYGTYPNGTYPGEMPPSGDINPDQGMPGNSIPNHDQPGMNPTDEADQGFRPGGQ